MNVPHGSSSPRADEGELLAEIGQALMPQNLRVSVLLPRELADRAVQAWERDDNDPDVGESEENRLQRVRAGHAALIGLAVEERGSKLPNGDVRVDLQAWQVGVALETNDEGVHRETR